MKLEELNLIDAGKPVLAGGGSLTDAKYVHLCWLGSATGLPVTVSGRMANVRPGAVVGVVSLTVGSSQYMADAARWWITGRNGFAVPDNERGREVIALFVEMAKDHQAAILAKRSAHQRLAAEWLSAQSVETILRSVPEDILEQLGGSIESGSIPSTPAATAGEGGAS